LEVVQRIEDEHQIIFGLARVIVAIDVYSSGKDYSALPSPHGSIHSCDEFF
jgi:hypothetical protein